MKKSGITGYLSRRELALLGSSVLLIILSFIIFDRVNYLALAASLIGAVSLIFCAKGNPLGQLLIIIFSLLYGVISYNSRCYGEMITYLGMTAPMAGFSLVSWLRNPYNGNRSEVKVNRLKNKEWLLIAALTAAVTLVFYFILKALGTAYLPVSTLSVTTSFIAVYLTFRRSPLYAIAYAANDTVLIILWTLAALSDKSYISVIICFITFLANDLYGYFNWKRIEKRQKS